MEEDNLNTIFEASYQNPREAQATLEAKGYKFDTELSSPDTKVFVDEKGNPHIAYRGTHRVMDWETNLKILTGKGKETAKAKEARETAKKVEAKYNKVANAYGHSQGGFLSEQSGVGGKVYTYNKAVAPTDIFKKVSNKQTDIRTTRDIVSLPSYFQSGSRKITIQSPSITDALSAHKLNALDFSKQTKAKFF
jgi:thymidylate synthase